MITITIDLRGGKCRVTPKGWKVNTTLGGQWTIEPPKPFAVKAGQTMQIKVIEDGP